MTPPTPRVTLAAAPRLLLAVAALALAPVPALAVDVRVSSDVGEGNTRLVITHSERTPLDVDASRRRITLHYTRPISVDPPEMRLEADDGLLRGWEQRDEYTLVLFLGADYERHETFELRNPFRLVVDLYGGTVRRSPRRRAEPITLPRTIVVLDPGHGGVERGAEGPAGLREKDVTLALARRLRRALQETDPSIAVVLTRDEDRAVGLDERTAIANHNKADLFISIHLNGSPRPDATGAETYYLSTRATDAEARTLAALENRAFEPDGPPSSEGTPDRPLDLVLWDLAQNRFLAESAALAESIQAHLNRLTGTRDRGVRQAPLRVLVGATMPAVLVEVGFISNPEEERLFDSPSYVDQVVQALVGAVGDFLYDLERLAGPRGATAGPAGGP